MESAFTSRFGELLDSPVKLVTIAVERDRGHSDALYPLRQNLAHVDRSASISSRGGTQGASHLRTLRRYGGQRPSRFVVDDLTVDVAIAPEDGKSRTLGRPADALPNMASTPKSSLVLGLLAIHDSRLLCCSRPEGLPRLAENFLALVTDSLSLVGFGLANSTYLGRKLADELLVHT